MDELHQKPSQPGRRHRAQIYNAVHPDLVSLARATCTVRCVHQQTTGAVRVINVKTDLAASCTGVVESETVALLLFLVFVFLAVDLHSRGLHRGRSCAQQRGWFFSSDTQHPTRRGEGGARLCGDVHALPIYSSIDIVAVRVPRSYRGMHSQIHRRGCAQNMGHRCYRWILLLITRRLWRPHPDFAKSSLQCSMAGFHG